MPVPYSVVKDFTVLNNMLDKSGTTELVVPETCFEGAPFKVSLLVELLKLALELHCGNQSAVLALVELDDVRVADLMKAANFCGHEGLLTALCDSVSHVLTAVETEDTEQHYLALIEGLDTLPYDLLVRVVQSTNQAVKLQLNAPALSTWFDQRGGGSVRVDAALGAGDIAHVLDALLLVPGVADLRLNCSELQTRNDFRFLVRGLQKVSKVCGIQTLRLQLPVTSREQLDQCPHNYVMHGLIAIMTALRHTLTVFDIEGEMQCGVKGCDNTVKGWVRDDSTFNVVLDACHSCSESVAEYDEEKADMKCISVSNRAWRQYKVVFQQARHNPCLEFLILHDSAWKRVPQKAGLQGFEQCAYNSVRWET